MTLLEANSLRKGLIVANISPADMYLFYGVGASVYEIFTVKIPGEGYWEMPYPIYTGLISCIWHYPEGWAIAVTELV